MRHDVTHSLDFASFIYQIRCPILQHLQRKYSDIFHFHFVLHMSMLHYTWPMFYKAVHNRTNSISTKSIGKFTK